MQNVTVRMHTRTIAELEREARNQHISRSEHIRTVLETRHEHERTQVERDRVRAEYERTIAELQAEIDDLETDLDRCEHRCDELLQMASAANRRNDETESLVRYVEEDQQSILEKLKWW